ncbi:hypothetical protein KC968_04685 [Candidatus Saccharibacteria bacterium]|nr:hypothetical protein [Candidatus Saccharibacteria bacterium]
MASSKKSKQTPRRHIVVVNVNGNLPGIGTALLQTAYDATFLKNRLIDYLVRSLEELPNPTDILAIQKVLHVQAKKVPELMMKNSDGENVYDFESNQRVDELIALLAINGSTNQMNRNRGENIVLVPAWQRPNQHETMKKFNGKESWDGFMHEFVPLGTEDPSMNVFVMPVEIKSLMINPHKENFANLNELLDKKTPDFSKHFQSEGSVCAVVVLPYVMDPMQTKLSFDLKKATKTINKHVTPGAIGCLLFFSFNDSGDGTTAVTVKCHFVSKKPRLSPNGNIDNVDMYELKFGSFRHVNKPTPE